MRLPRDISGRRLARSLAKRYGYERVHQAGSHMIVQTEQPRHHRIAVPDHAALRVGTLNAILKAVAAAQGTTKETVAAQLLR